MHIHKTLRGGNPAAIIVRRYTEERLRTTCFRGTSLRLAGNFSLWDSAKELFDDLEVLEYFLDEIEEVTALGCFQMTHSVNIECSVPVGWESTDRFENYDMEALERFKPNRKSNGLKVKGSCTDIRAPMTRLLTIIYELKMEGNTVVAVVHSIYPGVDIGELRGNVTEREGRIFFDFSHPGE